MLYSCFVYLGTESPILKQNWQFLEFFSTLYDKNSPKRVHMTLNFKAIRNVNVLDCLLTNQVN